MRHYGSVHTRFWSHPDIQKLSDQAKLLALYLLTGPHTNMLGCFRLPMGYVAEDLQWGFETVSKRFGELFQMGFATYDPEHQWVLIHHFLEWNPIENPNQGKSIRRWFEQLPEKSLLFNPLVVILQKHERYLEEGFRNGLETLSKPFRNQEQEQEQEQEQKQDQDPEQKQEQGEEQEKRARSIATRTVPKSLAPPQFPAMEKNCPAVSEIPQEPTATALLTIPLSDGSEFPIFAAQVEEWQSQYPAVPVLQTLHTLRGWNVANPSRRKTRSGIVRHIVTWLAKEQNQQRPNDLLREPRGLKDILRPHPLHERNGTAAHRWLHPNSKLVEDPEETPTTVSQEQFP